MNQSASITLPRAAPGGAKLPQAALPELIAASLYENVFDRGVRAIYERASPAAPPALALPPARPPLALPSAAELAALVNAALLAATRAALNLKRGDLGRAKYQSGVVLKQQLLTSLQGRARCPVRASRPGHKGRYLDRWAEPAAVAALPGRYGG